MSEQITSVERALVSAALMGPDVLDHVDVKPHDILHQPSRRVWTAMLALHGSGKVANDIALLHAELGQGASSLLSDAMAPRESDATTLRSRSSARQYAEAVLDASLHRRVKTALLEAASAPGSGSDILENAWSSLFAISGTEHSEGAVQIGQAIREAYQAISKRIDGGPPSGVMSGFSQLDSMYGPIPIGTVTLVAGRPSMGKSALSRSFAFNALESGCGAHIFSQEDTRDVYATRQIADESGVPLDRLINARNITRGELDRLRKVAEKHATSKLLIDETVGLSSAQIAMRVRRHAKANNTKVVVVDYVQLMHEPGAKGDKQREVALAAEGLVGIARREKVAMVVLSQLNRDLERREDKRPLLSDLRESGVLEQVASKVLMCHRPIVFKTEDESLRHVAEVIVRKNKNGKTGSAPMYWDDERATFRNNAPQTRRFDDER